MAIASEPTLLRLGGTDLVLADPAHDVRGRPVVDRNGNDLGEVDDLMITQGDQRVRFLDIAAGGFLGIGESHVLIPVDAIASMDDDAITVNADGTHVAGAPQYDPDLTSEPNEYYTQVYEHYGYPPFWVPGYVYPPLFPKV